MNQQNLVLLFIALLVAAALFFTLSAKTQAPQANETAATPSEDLLLKGIGFGEGETDYVYSFTRTYNGYDTHYRLTKDGNESMAEIKSPLSQKQVYFLENDTVLCIEYGKKQGCSSVEGDARLDSYLNSIKAEFFSDAKIDKNFDDMEYLLDKGYVTFQGGIIPKTINGTSCGEVVYTLDYSNITLGDAARFGIGSTAPKLFMRSMCIDNSTGYRLEETLNYTYNGMQHQHVTRLVSFSSGGAEGITPPENLSKGAVDILIEERSDQLELNECFTEKEGEERESCVSKIALRSKKPDLCSLSGSRMDLCLISIVPLTKDVSICGLISSEGYKDDCYIELAGAYKNGTYCGSILNQSKVEYCMNVSMPIQKENQAEDNESGMDSMDILNYIEASSG